MNGPVREEVPAVANTYQKVDASVGPKSVGQETSNRKKTFKQRVVEAYRKFRHDKPGDRFLNAYRRWGSSLSSSQRLFVSFLGVLLIVVGGLLGLVPGVPGVLLAMVGLVLIAIRSRRLAGALDRGETALRRIWRKVRRRATNPSS